MPAPDGAIRTRSELSARDEQILAAAAVAFGERGFHGVGMDELGTRAGLSGPTLYRHFHGKDEILATLLNHAMDELMALLVTGADPSAALAGAVRQHVRFALERRDLVVLHQREAGNLVEPWAAAFSRRMGQYTRRWEALFAAVIPTATDHVVAATTQGCLGTIFSVSTWPARARRVGDPVAVEDLVLGLVHRGIDRDAGSSLSRT